MCFCPLYASWPLRCLFITVTTPRYLIDTEKLWYHSYLYLNIQTFTCFVFSDIWNSLACRSSSLSFMKLPPNNFFNLAVLFCLMGQFFVIYLPFFQNIFQTEALSLAELFFITFVSSLVLFVDEIGFHSKFRYLFDGNQEYTPLEKQV